MANPTESVCPPAARNDDADRATVTVAVVDDHRLVQMAMRTLMEKADNLDLVGEADNLDRARAMLAKQRPDVVLVDAHLPDNGGLVLCREATERGIKVVMLAATAAEDFLVEAMRAGASGYVLSGDDTDELLAALDAVGGGGAHFSGAATPQMLAVIAAGGVTDDPLAELTERERQLLALLGEGLSNRQISERLFLGERTVKNYVSRLLRKLGMERRVEAAVFAARLEARRDSSWCQHPH